MLRHPVERILSLYYFLKGNENISLSEFLMNKRYRELDNDQTRRLSGMDPPFGACKTAHLERALFIIQRHFVMVGLVDRFDESVLVLKNLMDWQQEFLYYPRNVTKGRPKTEEISRECYEQILNLNRLDLQLYEAANVLLDEKIGQEGSDFSRQLAGYRNRLSPKVNK
jgi:hypothetical protein